VHCAPNRLVTAEGEAQVRKAAADVRSRAALADLARRLDEIEGIAAMLVDTRRDREDIGVEDDVVRLGPVGGEKAVRAARYRDLA